MSITFDTLVADAHNTTSTTEPLSVSLTVGRGIPMWLTSDGNVSPTGVADTAAGGTNTYFQVGSAVYNSNDDQTVTQWYCKSAKATETVTITATWATNRITRGIAAVPCAGHDQTATPAGIVGPVQINIATTDGITTTNITPSAQPGSIIAMTCNTHTNAQAVGTGFTDRGSSFANWAGVMGMGTRAESATYSSLSAFAATFTNGGDGLGRNITPGMMIPDAASADTLMGQACL